MAFARTDAGEWGGKFSPDGRWIAYVSDESGQSEVYVKRYPPTEEEWQITTDFGKEPVWSPAGDELFYLDDNHVNELGSAKIWEAVGKAVVRAID